MESKNWPQPFSPTRSIKSEFIYKKQLLFIEPNAESIIKNAKW